VVAAIVMEHFRARIRIIGVNPYVLLPAEVLAEIFTQAGRDKGPIQVKGKLQGHPFKQNLVKYAGKWRLYLNTPMRKAAGREVGDEAEVWLAYDAEERTLVMHPKLEEALRKNKKAKAVFDQLPQSRRKEIVRYIGFLKTEESVERNVTRAIGFLNGTQRFIGRDTP
jgi:hypothetical protein